MRTVKMGESRTDYQGGDEDEEIIRPHPVRKEKKVRSQPRNITSREFLDSRKRGNVYNEPYV